MGNNLLLESLFLDDNELYWVYVKNKYANPTQFIGINQTYEVKHYPYGAWVGIEDLENLLAKTNKRWCHNKRCYLDEKIFVLFPQDKIPMEAMKLREEKI